MAVEVCEVSGSPTFGFSLDGRVTCTRKLKFAWADLSDFMEEYLPPSEFFGTEVRQYLGSPCPYLRRTDSVPSMWAESVEVGPYYGSEQVVVSGEGANLVDPVVYSEAIATVTYAAAEFDVTSFGLSSGNKYFTVTSLLIDPVPYLVHRSTSGGQLLSAPGPTYWKWTTTGIPLREGIPVPLMVSTGQHSATWLRVPVTDDNGDSSMFLAMVDKWEDFKGRVNDSLPLWFGGTFYPEETLLYVGYDRHPLVMTNGREACDVTFNFESKFVFDEDGEFVGGHNHYWDDTEAVWDRVVKIADATKRPYYRETLKNLFNTT